MPAGLNEKQIYSSKYSLAKQFERTIKKLGYDCNRKGTKVFFDGLGYFEGFYAGCYFGVGGKFYYNDNDKKPDYLYWKDNIAKLIEENKEYFLQQKLNKELKNEHAPVKKSKI